MQTLLSDGVSQGHLLLSVSLSELSRKAPTGFFLDQPKRSILHKCSFGHRYRRSCTVFTCVCFFIFNFL